MKIGLAARVSQAMGLMQEPGSWLPTVEQEERRRTFWSVYILDKLISCGRSRPQIIYDHDCQLQLPCKEDMFRNSKAEMTLTLHRLSDWNTDLTDGPGPFTLVVFMSSILGRCTRYLCGERDDIPPWDTKSEYSTIGTRLLLFESYAKMDTATGLDAILMSTSQDPQTGIVDQQRLGHHIFAHVLFHLCHCLLNHPFLLYLCCKPLRSKVPRSFLARALQTGVEHATLLIEFLETACQSGIRTESSFYSYCVAIAGGIHSIASHAEQSSLSGSPSDMKRQVQRDLSILDRLAKFWTNAANMVGHFQCLSSG